ncbi:MAG: YfcE family phosphodiesterase [Nitrososphaerota archaeon]|nr:YfcE family phosphodiesterase [Nitrososphaerota archaeon]
MSEVGCKQVLGCEGVRVVGLISDTHIPKRALCLPQQVFELFAGVDHIIHGGDLVEFAVVDVLEQIAPVLAVCGNMDGVGVGDVLPRLGMFGVFNWKIGVMHDPGAFFGRSQMRALVCEHGFDVFVYGHTHVADIGWEGSTLYINPGSPTVPASVFSRPSVGLLTITPQNIVPQILKF